MKDNVFYTASRPSINNRWLLPVLGISIFAGWLVAVKGVTIAMLGIMMPFVIAFVVLVFTRPRTGFIFFIIYCFITPYLGRQFSGVQFGLGQDGMLLLMWLGILFHRSDKFKFRYLNNDLVWIGVIWFVLTVLEIANPEKPSIVGWFYEMRSITLYWMLSVPLVFWLFNKKSDVDLFFKIIILLSLAGALYGVKQLVFGTNAAENRWLEAGAKSTHILFGKLRVFSYYAEAAQFGASQAHLAIMCIILAVGPHGRKKKLLYLAAGLVIFYGMLISGTRGALFGLVGGGFTFLILSKQVRILLLGGIIGVGFLFILKFTSIGNGSAQMVRLRTSLDPNDLSLQARLHNQQTLSNFLQTRPFGAGVGVLGMWGVKFNKGKFISTIPPDSLFVKIWAMYGIIGFLIWFGCMLYILGKCAGIVWKTRDPVLRNKLAALCSGAAGILLCSYGNEVLNQMPSAIICYTTWALIWLSPRWDTPKTNVEDQPVNTAIPIGQSASA